ncbi:MAG: HNH endonuclease signature motif containing protein [Pseudonocardiaceae bacterium]
MTVRQLLPEGLAEMAPGPQLGAALAGLELRALAGSDLVEVLQARARQLAHEQAQLLAVMAEIGWCDPYAGPDEVARLAELPGANQSLVPPADEIRAALAWTRNAAYREYHFAQSLLRRLPTVFTALDTGVICRSKAWLFSELCAELTDEQAQVVVERLLPKAGRLTTGELAARIKKMAIALDPEWAARRYATAVRDRDVIGYLDEDGTATVTGRRLPADQAAAACARIEDLAKAAKRAGYPGRIGPLRADIYVGLLDGRWTQHSREEIIIDLLARATPADQSTPDDTPQRPSPDDSFVAEGAPADGQPVANAVPEADGEPADDGEPAVEEAGSGDIGCAADAADEADDTAADTSPADSSVGGEAGETDRSCVPGTRVGVELRVGLSTLLGLDRHPGEIPGWGAVTAETARDLAAAQRRAEWRYAITDPEGLLILGGITRRRPRAPGSTEPDSGSNVGLPTTNQERAPVRGGIVELHIPATLLTELAAHPETCGPWVGVISDLDAQYRTARTQGASVTQDPAARFAGAALRRHIQIRDRCCVYLGCRCSARQADLDHTLDHSHGGATTEANSGPLCKHDHRLKHEGGWRLYQPEPGHFIWISPLGREYHTRPQPIGIDLPDPLPGPKYPHIPPPATDDDEPILYRPPPEPQPPPAPAVDPDEPPPF